MVSPQEDESVTFPGADAAAGLEVLAILQARMSSRRLPGKVLKPILGRPMLAMQIERLRRCGQIDHLVVATSLDATDTAIAQLCDAEEVPCYRGSLDDVLDRYYQAARLFQPSYVVRLTGDCPLADPYLIDEIIKFCRDGGYDFVSNAIERTFPVGLDAAVLRYSVLEQTWQEATLPAEREHVTQYIRHHPERFKIGTYTNSTNRSHLRWTVDEPADFSFVNAIYERLYPDNPGFRSDDIYQLLEREPDLLEINREVNQMNAG